MFLVCTGILANVQGKIGALYRDLTQIGCRYDTPFHLLLGIMDLQSDDLLRNKFQEMSIPFFYAALYDETFLLIFGSKDFDTVWFNSDFHTTQSSILYYAYRDIFGLSHAYKYLFHLP